MYSVETHNVIFERAKVSLAQDMPLGHAHPYYELYFLISGERRYLIGHKIYDVEPGNLILVSPNELHHTVAPGTEGYSRYLLYFTEDCVESLAASIGKRKLEELLKDGCFRLPEVYVETVREILEQIEEEQEHMQEFSAAVMENLLQRLFLYVFRHGERKQCETRAGADKIQKVARYISGNYSSEFSLRDAASMACMEETYFSKKFRQMTGMGFKEYLISTRIKNAARLLVSTDLSISEISDRCGFSGSNYFGDVFRSHTGVSPSEYRKVKRVL